MTDEQYKAKKWLMRLRDYSQNLKTEEHTLFILKTRINGGVVNYYSYTGRRDPIVSRAAYEDAIIDYSEQAARVEKAQKEYIAEMISTRNLFDSLPIELRGLAIDKYLNDLKIEQLIKIYELSRAEIMRQNIEILEHVAQILKAKNTPLIINQDKKQEAAAV